MKIAEHALDGAAAGDEQMLLYDCAWQMKQGLTA